MDRSRQDKTGTKVRYSKKVQRDSQYTADRRRGQTSQGPTQAWRQEHIHGQAKVRAKRETKGIHEQAMFVTGI